MNGKTERYTLGISCIVLAGGKGVRLGRDKVSETIGSRSLLQRVLSNISSLSSDIIIVTAKEQSFPQFTDYSKLRVIADVYPGKGALGGIYTGLIASESFYSLVVASDMPFLNPALLEYMIEFAANFDLVAPRVGSLVEPLHAVYSKDCLAPIEGLIKQGNLKVIDLLPLVRVRYIEADEIDRFDPKHLSFFNINTEADLETARKIIKGK